MCEVFPIDNHQSAHPLTQREPPYADSRHPPADYRLIWHALGNNLINQYFYIMKRSLLLLPFLAMFLMACPEKHATTSATPGAPDPNGYNTAPHPTGNGGVTTTGNSGSVNTSNNSTGGSVRPDTVKGPEATTSPVVVGKGDTTRLIVSFISKGEGIDHAAKENLDKWLAKHADVTYYLTQKGREGEVEYCFMMKDRNAMGQKKMVEDIRTTIGSSDRVLYKENVVCAHAHASPAIQPDNGTVVIAPTEQSKPTVDTTRLIVAFTSKGAGIDHEAKDRLDKYLSKHPDVKYFVTQKGREGEMEYCFMLHDRKAIDQKKLVEDIRTTVGSSDRVFYRENEVCTHKHVEAAASSSAVIAEGTGARPDSTDNTARLVVSFTSKGAGIDHKTKDEFEKWLAQRGDATWETTTYGREGETNFCFRLANMDSRRQEIFVKDVRTFLSGKETVFVEEYAPCDKRK